MEKTFGSYDRVLMIGVDGMGSFNSRASTPNIDKLFENGAVTYTALSSRPTVSGPCWTSMLTGAIPEVHMLFGVVIQATAGGWSFSQILTVFIIASVSLFMRKVRRFTLNILTASSLTIPRFL